MRGQARRKKFWWNHQGVQRRILLCWVCFLGWFFWGEEELSVLLCFGFFFYNLHFQNNMLWKLFLPLICPCSSSVAVLAVMLWKRTNAGASSQSWHGRSREVSVSVALGELTEMVLWLRHWGLSLKKCWRPAVKGSWSKKLQLQKRWAVLSWKNLWAGICSPLS